ncbi:MAG TPA: hypothetical protein VMB23_04240 [Spirochaetia bacterium]|jgi:hypothetical protein|nr:hypothetical protein [Spirochaetia bacterium]
MDKEIRQGVKTFFLNADPSMSPDDSQLQVLLRSGFEVHRLPETRLIPLSEQIACLVGLFPELIVYLNIESSEGGDWPAFLAQVAETHGTRLKLGVLHHRDDPAERRSLEQTYLFGLRLQAGCVYVPLRSSFDLPLIHRLLVANQANGRRRAVRLACRGRLNLVSGGRRFEGRVTEVSVSHFLCTFRGADPEFAEATRWNDVQLVLGGAVVRTDAVVLLKRVAPESGGELVYVCGFVQPNGQLETPAEVMGPLLRLIQEQLEQGVSNLVLEAFQRRWAARVLGGTPAPVAVN